MKACADEIKNEAVPVENRARYTVYVDVCVYTLRVLTYMKAIAIVTCFVIQIIISH